MSKNTVTTPTTDAPKEEPFEGSYNEESSLAQIPNEPPADTDTNEELPNEEEELHIVERRRKSHGEEEEDMEELPPLKIFFLWNPRCVLAPYAPHQ